MKAEYDFSKAERGKFFKKNIKMQLPVYLNASSLSFVDRLAKQRKTDISSVVNLLIKEDMRLAEMLR